MKNKKLAVLLSILLTLIILFIMWIPGYYFNIEHHFHKYDMSYLIFDFFTGMAISLFIGGILSVILLIFMKLYQAITE